MKRWLKVNRLFVALVIAPTIAAAIYWGLISSDVYISESHFLVKSPQRQVQSGLVGQLLQSTGISKSQDDTYSVRDFILSRDALSELDKKLKIRSLFSSEKIDAFNRFPGLGKDQTFEELYRYYLRHVSVEYDAVSSISVLTARAFTPQDAFAINGMLLEMSERLVNTLNARSRQDLIQFAESEVKIASDKVNNSSLALLTYRSAHSIFQPDRQAAIQLEGVAKIQQELVSTETELAQLKKLSPSNPQISALASRAETLRTAIASEASKVTSANGSFSANAPIFERLALDVEFADKQLGVALAELETARGEALQKQLYLEPLVQPNLPDKALEPRRLRSVFTVFMLGIVVWGVVRLLVASIREHAD